MTRGKIIFIDADGKMYCTTEFNGDMYPEGKANEVLEKFEEGYFNSYQNFEHFVERFNKRHFGYGSELVHKWNQSELVINIHDNTTDFLYVINNSDRQCIIVDKHDNPTFLTQNSLAIVCFTEVEKAIHRTIKEIVEWRSEKLSKKEFSGILDRLKEATDLVKKVNELFRNSRDSIECDFCNAAALQISHESIAVRLLKLIMNDHDEWIDYFIYELDYGRNYKDGTILDEDGSNIDISSSNKLYDFLSDTCATGQKEV